ncbi:MAG TPA: FHA domain-containing protein [Cyanobacteria bacterium UBA8553]|nr:FHA domain-containing protein [Cyanobacteria bacterium UBA8553]HAJ64388.1 FHA domain-containing protein [Cyanobacteria bacterium UBA8543]
MNEITLEWQEAGRIRRETIRDQQRSTYPGIVRLGRDPTRCDLVLSDPTVSGLHVEVFFNTQQRSFAVRNLRDANPPMVDGQQILKGEAFLSQGSTIYLGQVELKVVAVSLGMSNNGIAPTLLLPPLPLAGVHQPNPDAVYYGLQCPHCDRISPYDRLDWGCQWCGTSLAAATSVLMTPNGN